MPLSTTRSALRVVCVGQAVQDRIYRVSAIPTGPGKVRAQHMLESGGGMAANAAVAIARLGGAVSLWSRVGDDQAGTGIRQELAGEGVDVTHVRGFPGARSATSAILVEPSGERLIVHDPGTGLAATADWLPLADLNPAHVGCVLADARWPEATLAAFATARAVGVATVLDADRGSAGLADILALTDYAIFAEPALAEFAATAHLDPAQAGSVWQALNVVRATGVRHCGVTLGAQGYFWLGTNGQAAVQAAFPVRVVDTTGAGDAFHGAFSWCLAQGMDETQAARLAAAVAALNCTQAGGRTGLPTLARLRAFLATTP